MTKSQKKKKIAFREVNNPAKNDKKKSLTRISYKSVNWYRKLNLIDKNFINKYK